MIRRVARAIAPDGWGAGAGRYPPPLSDPGERQVAGRIGGALYVVGAGLIGILAAVGSSNAWAMGGLGVVTGIVGLVMVAAVSWRRVPPWIFFALTLYGVVILGAATALTAGVDSPPLLMGAAIIAFTCSFFTPRIAVGVVALITVVTILPVLYDKDADRAAVTELFLTLPVQVGLAVGVMIGADRVRALAASRQRLAREQGMLLDLAKEIAAEHDDGDEIFVRAARDAAQMLDGCAGALLRYTEDDSAVLVADWTDGLPGMPVGSVLPAGPATPPGQVRASGRPMLHAIPDEPSAPLPVGELRVGEMALAPVRARGRLWGLVSVAVAPERTLPDDALDRLSAFADLIGTAVMNRESRRQLVDQATRDPLTGLSNHRAFHERLRPELARAQRYGRELSLVLLDVDHFKEVNDAAGHDVGDRVLVTVAERLREGARVQDTIARIGGDEFAMLLPETDGVQAFAAVERTRALIGASPVLPGVSVTTSAGICDLRNATDADTMFRLADGALYWSKAHGRDATWIYDPEVVRELSAAERAEQLRRSQALLGIRALARAIDAKDPSTRRHSQRVAALARRLAEILDWEPGRASLLEEAALVHDVGKIGVPDAVLLKPGRLSATERGLVGKHADLGAQIVEDVLTEEQVEWIRSHHERPDGQGYPRGLAGAQISDGAAILTVADSFDVMTMTRSYSAAKGLEEALAECEGLVGRQFDGAVVTALAGLHARGELVGLMAGGVEEGDEPFSLDPVQLPPLG